MSRWLWYILGAGFLIGLANVYAGQTGSNVVMGIIWLLVIGRVLLRLFGGADRDARKQPGSSSRRRSRATASVQPGDVFHWPSTGGCWFEVGGESNYQPALAEAAGGQPARGDGIEVTAWLVPEDSNRFDPYAVAVQVDGNTVGYLSRDDARSFRRRLGQKGLKGCTSTCGASIVGGGQRSDGTQLFYGIRLDLKPFA